MKFALRTTLAAIVCLSVTICIRAASTEPSMRKLSPKLVRPGIGPVARAFEESYPYHSPRFTQFLVESHVYCKPAEAHDFYAWMDKAYAGCNHRFPGKESLSLEDLLDSKKRQFSRISDPLLRSENEIAFSAWIHRMVKTVIPRFSLDRGYEFCNVIRCGERQCFLQSVLIAGLLQYVGFDAGVVMVYRNPKGEESNLGHAIVLLKLPDGRDIIVDASEPEPFYKPRGIFVREREYRFVNPVYLKYSSRIVGYKTESRLRDIAAEQVRSLDYSFVRSQFWYYRGERAKGGLLASRPTSEGLAQSSKAFRQSVKFCAKNPLSMYMLGRVYSAQGKYELAKKQFQEAHDLYTRFGWIPSDPERYYEKTSM
jgi:hypothetical protein